MQFLLHDETGITIHIYNSLLAYAYHLKRFDDRFKGSSLFFNLNFQWLSNKNVVKITCFTTFTENSKGSFAIKNSEVDISSSSEAISEEMTLDQTHGAIKTNRRKLFIITIEDPKYLYMDISWCKKVQSIYKRHVFLRTSNAFASTLGGGFFLSRKIQEARQMAFTQHAIALELGDYVLASQCRIHFIYTLIQTDDLDFAKYMIKREAFFLSTKHNNKKFIIERSRATVLKRMIKSAKIYLRNIQKHHEELRRPSSARYGGDKDKLKDEFYRQRFVHVPKVSNYTQSVLPHHYKKKPIDFKYPVMTDFDDVSDALSIIITTSVAPCHPSTKLIRAVMNSLVYYEPSLLKCRKIIMCDKPIVKNHIKLKSGLVTEGEIPKYEKYKENLHHLVNGTWDPTVHEPEEFLDNKEGEIQFEKEQTLKSFQNTILVELSTRHGFAYAVKKGLVDYVTTPYVMIVQHDRCLARSFGTEKILRAMMQRPKEIKYVGLLQKRTTLYWIKMRAKYKLDIIPYAFHMQAGKYNQKSEEKLDPSYIEAEERNYTLYPLLFWYDSTHIAEVKNYLDLVFSDGKIREQETGTPHPCPEYCPKFGDFIEDTFGHGELGYVKKVGMTGHAVFGAYLLDDGIMETMVSHLDGRKKSWINGAPFKKKRAIGKSFLVTQIPRDSASASSSASHQEGDENEECFQLSMQAEEAEEVVEDEDEE